MNMNKFMVFRILTALSLIIGSLSVSTSVCAQSPNYESRYNLLVSQLGPAGIGIETLLQKWEAVDSTDRKMLLAKFDYYFTKSQSEQVVKKSQNKYLGMDPLLSLKDSTGTPVYYYKEQVYDDELFAKALKVADRLAAFYPDDLEYRFLKANALIAYEKESPDMATAYLSDLISQDQSRTRPWNYEGNKQDKNFFPDSMQEYCRTFYTIGSDAAMETFLSLSKHVGGLYPDMTCFVSNIATYYLVGKDDPKSALKYYAKVLKKVKDDEVALRNACIAARKAGNRKLELKYQQLLRQYGYVK